ncbi:6-bladed beta-propeller [Geofilum sp. OHC36d9]|uniref:6-bladed beta-propeller n=1 Tax=Geofilum sp. OHC36d9 TaxID=3458413 RepID=UPI0040344ED6
MKNTQIGNFFFLILLGSILVVSCENESSQNNDFITINLSPKNDSLIMSQFISNVDYVPLKTPANFPIGNIESVVIHDNFFFVNHTATKAVISVFNAKGDFQYNIGSIGRGPGEYVAMHGFTINTETNDVIIMDLMTQKMHYYTEKGKYLKSEKLPIHGLDIMSFENGFVFWVGNLHNTIINKDVTKLWNLYVTNSNLEITNKFLEVPKEFMGVMQGSLPSSLSPYKDGVNIVQPLSNYIYEYKKGELKTKYYLDFGSLNCDFLGEFRKDKGNPGSFLFRLRKTGATYYFSHFFEFNNYLYFTFLSGNEMYSTIYDKNQNIANVGKGYPIDDINDAIFGKTVGSYQGHLISVIDPVLLLDDENNVPPALQYLQLTENSNPVLAIYKIH